MAYSSAIFTQKFFISSGSAGARPRRIATSALA